MTSASRRRRVFDRNAARWVFVESMTTLHTSDTRNCAQCDTLAQFVDVLRGDFLKDKGGTFRMSRMQVFGKSPSHNEICFYALARLKLHLSVEL